MIRLAFLLIIWLFSFLVTLAQTHDLSNCINYALEHNIAIVNQKTNTKIAHETLNQSKRNLLPSINAVSSGNLFYGKSIDPTTNNFISQEFFSTNFYLGTQIDLFNGFVKQNTIKFNRFQHLKQEEQTKQLERLISFEVMNAFYDVLYYKELSEVVKEQLDLTQMNVTKVNKLIQLGLKAEADLLEIQAQEATEQHNLLRVNNQEKLAVIQLKKAMNYPLEQPIELKEDKYLIPDEKINVDDIYNTASLNAPELKMADFDKQAADKQIAIARGNLLPNLSLGGNYRSYYANSNKEINNGQEQIIPFKDQFSQNASQNVYLSLQIPLFEQWRRQSQVKTARLKQQMAAQSYQEAEQELYQQIHEDYQQFESLQKEYIQLSVQLQLQHKAFEIAEKKMEQGLISVLEFYTAKNLLGKAKADLLRTRMLLKIKEKTLSYYTTNQ